MNVECASSSFCVASDAGGNVLTFDGQTWSQPTAVDPNGPLYYLGLPLFTVDSCPSVSLCVGHDALGYVFTGVTPPAPALSSPSSLTFGSQTVSHSGPVQWLPVVNSGTSISGTDAGDFTIPAGDDLCAGRTLAPQGTCWIGVQFTAAASGSRSATLAFGASNLAEAPATVALTGTGTDAVTGPQGPAGPPGPAGQQGAPGLVELVTCKPASHQKTKHRAKSVQHCRVKVVHGTAQFVIGHARATVSRGGTVLAVGSAKRLRNGSYRLALAASRRIRPGHYVLTLRDAHGNRILRHQILIA
jgi:hypothetical protein